MQGHSDDWIQNRILRSLGKRGLPDGHGVLGQESLREMPIDLRSVADLGHVGRPVASFVGDPGIWTLLGTDAVQCCLHGQGVFVRLDDIREVLLVDGTLVPPPPCQFIELIDRHGNKHTIWAPPGPGCLGLCGVLQMLVQLQR